MGAVQMTHCFKPISKSSPAPQGGSAVMYVDGSCPANPGLMGIGVVIMDSASPRVTSTTSSETLSAGGIDNQTELGYRLGEGTNNRAEYLALIFGMREALRQGITHITIFSDSLLVVNQVNGLWKTNPTMRALWTEACGLRDLFTGWDLSHIPREQNERADHLSKNPTEPALLPSDIEVDLASPVRRRLLRRQAACIRWWWLKGICQNEYRLVRIFGGTESHLGKIGRGKGYTDLTEGDLTWKSDTNTSLYSSPTTASGFVSP